jgi:hypothetical protein
MTEVSQSDSSRSRVTILIEQQKYEEALPILSDLREKNPSDQGLRICYLLVLRILVLRWNLARAESRPASYAFATAERIIGRLASVARVSKRLKIIQSFVYQAAQTPLANPSAKRVIIAGAAFGCVMTLPAFHRVDDGNVAGLAPSIMASSTDAAHLSISASEAKARSSNESATADGDVRQALLPKKADEENFFAASAKPSELPPADISMPQVAAKGHVRNFAEPEPTLFGTDVAKAATPQVGVSSASAKGRQPKAVLHNVESSRGATADKDNKTAPRMILAHYQSRRAIPIRKAPRFAAATVQQIDGGILLDVLEFIGSWAKVELRSAGITGFVRREFLIAINSESSATHGASSLEETSDGSVSAFGSTS